MRWTRIWEPFRANLSIYWFYWFFAILDHGVVKTCLLGFLNTLNKNDNYFARNIDLLILSIFPHFRSGTDKNMSSWVSQYAEDEYDKHFAWNIGFSILLIFGSSAQWSSEDISPGVPRYTEYEYYNHFLRIRRFDVTEIALLTFRPQDDGKRHLGFANMLITKIMEILMNLSMIVIGLSSMM